MIKKVNYLIQKLCLFPEEVEIIVPIQYKVLALPYFLPVRKPWDELTQTHTECSRLFPALLVMTHHCIREQRWNF